MTSSLINHLDYYNKKWKPLAEGGDSTLELVDNFFSWHVLYRVGHK